MTPILCTNSNVLIHASYTCISKTIKPSVLFVGQRQTVVVMDGTLAPAIFKPEKNLVFFQDKITGARDAAPGKLE